MILGANALGAVELGGINGGQNAKFVSDNFSIMGETIDTRSMGDGASISSFGDGSIIQSPMSGDR